MVGIDELQDIYLLYADTVKKFLICLTNNYDLSEELMQETFYQACKSISRYNGQCKMSVWLCQIAKHLFYDYLKKNKKYKLVNNTDEIESFFNKEDEEIGIEEKIIIREEAEIIYKIAMEIKEPYGKVFLLRVIAELNFQEIGAIYQKSANWARVIFYRGKSIILERMNVNESDM